MPTIQEALGYKPEANAEPENEPPSFNDYENSAFTVISKVSYLAKASRPICAKAD